MTRAALYARVSTVSKNPATGDYRQNPDMQWESLRPFARARGWEITGEFCDRVSGSTSSRPELDRLMAQARRREIDVVAVYRLDRFARSTGHLITALNEFQALGIDFVSCTEQMDTTTPMGRLIFTVIAALAEFERELIRERVRDGIAAARAKGKHIGRDSRVIDLELARMHLAEGRSLRETAKLMGVGTMTLSRRIKTPLALPGRKP